MPIKPENKQLYSKNWQEIRQKILKRAKNTCEFCNVVNNSKIKRENKTIKIVLTIAHLNHDPTDNDPKNLKALCQKCHLNYDLTHHLENRMKTRERKMGLIPMF